jgi:type II secretory pathway component PulJ
MITTTLSPIRKPARLAGFTLAEVMISAAISSFILAGVLATFLFLGRSGANIQNYSDMESEARKALEVFAEDTRQASSIAWDTKDDITLTVNSVSIRYYYDSSAKTFFRKVASGTPQALVTKITTFAFSAYSITGSTLPLTSATELTTAAKSTKQLQVSLEAARNSSTVATASNTVLSARFILRNKRVTT